MNKSMNLPAIERIMSDFERQSALLDMKDETMADAMDGILGDQDGEEAQEAEDEIVQQVLDEMGITLKQQVSLLHFLLPLFHPLIICASSGKHLRPCHRLGHRPPQLRGRPWRSARLPPHRPYPPRRRPRPARTPRRQRRRPARHPTLTPSRPVWMPCVGHDCL